MKRFGVKLTNGKILWIEADEADCAHGALLFYRNAEGTSRVLIAGFSLTQISHFGVPDAFAGTEA